jgi:spore germination cell wall hydrolase CwlJ-like protein
VQQKAEGNAIEGSATVGIVVQQKVAHPSLPVTLSGTLCSEWGCSTVLG